MRRLIVFVMAMALLGLTGTPSTATVRDPNGADVPFYARIDPDGFAPSDGNLTMVYFYRPPECVPSGFNLLNFFDIPGAFFCGPPTTEGFTLWETGVFLDPGPFFSHLSGLGAVPVWFVDTRDYEDAVSDGELTIGELEGLSPLKGTASHFNEVLRPSEAASVPGTSVSLKGYLEDGRAFIANHVHVHVNELAHGDDALPSTTNITIG